MTANRTSVNEALRALAQRRLGCGAIFRGIVVFLVCYFSSFLNYTPRLPVLCLVLKFAPSAALKISALRGSLLPPPVIVDPGFPQLGLSILDFGIVECFFDYPFTPLPPDPRRRNMSILSFAHPFWCLRKKYFVKNHFIRNWATLCR